MANHKSAIKRHRQSLVRNDRNNIIRSTVRTAIKKVRAEILAKNKDGAAKSLLVAESEYKKNR